MSFFRQYSTIIGGLILALVIVALVSIPSNILASQATFIGTELRYASENELPIRTRMDFGDVEHMKTFPMNFGPWLGLDFDSSEMAENLDADFILLRTYLNTSYYQPIDFVIMQGQEPSSFHPPPICYQATGWEIEEEGMEEIIVSSGTWASATEPISIDARKLVAFKESNGEVNEREIALYFYVKGRLFEDTVTMIEVSAAAPIEGPFDEALTQTKGFMAEIVPLLFEPIEQEGEMLAIYLARSWGGRVLIAVLVLIPLAMLLYPRVRRTKS
ncbi:MAG: exosortase-associated EpsI family protein [Chloroflexota bacterium]|nr:exosortase-associated EpsI family protein [Chloroflexota bacterium]